MATRDERLKEIQKERPLQSYWLKRDYVSEFDVIFIYYNVEPFDLNYHPMPLEQFLSFFDTEYLWEIMRGSTYPFVYSRGIPLGAFIEFLAEKGLPIPLHLQHFVPVKSKVDEIKVNDNDPLLSKRPVQLQKDFGRIYAIFAWKKPENQKKSAAKLVETKDFQIAMKMVGAENIDIETHAEWISDLSPFSKKKK